MPPKKRTRISAAVSPAAPPSEPAPAEGEEEEEEEEEDEHEEDSEATLQARMDAQIVADPWTDEEEIGLFKGLIKWKPAGMHKHFHLLALQQYLVTNGYIHPGAPHTRVPGIWAKLRTLYDLDALDERESAHALPWSPGADDEADESGAGAGEDGDDGELDPEFELPEDEFGDLMWRQRFPKEGEEDDEEERDESPAAVEELVARPDSPPVRFTPSFEIAPSEGKPTPSRKGKASSAAKPKPKVGGRASAVAAATRRSSRVADSVDPEDDEEGDEEGEESGEESVAGSAASGTPAPRAKTRLVPRSRPKSRPKRKR